MADIRELKDSFIFLDGCVEDFIKREITTRNPLTIDATIKFQVIGNEDINKKLFMVYNGVLRQFRVKKQVFFPFNYTYTLRDTKVYSAILIEIASIGKKWVRAYNSYPFGSLPFDVFASVDDYKRNIPYQINYYTHNASDIAALYTDFGFCSFSKTYSTYNSRVYKWDGVKVVSFGRKTNVRLCFIWDGIEFDINNKNVKKPFYVFEEDCRLDNSIKVEYFTDDEEDTTEDDLDVIVDVSVKITKSNVDKLLNFVDNL